MLRLLYMSQDETQRLTVITDGIDSQMNVFVTEDPVGDVSAFNSLGIVIEPGHTYNIGLLIEWAYANAMTLISYPEGLNEQSKVLASVTESVEYTLTVTPDTMSFPATGGSIPFTIESSKQKYVNGRPEGSVESVGFSFSFAGAGFSSEGNNVNATENPSDSVRTGTFTVAQDEVGSKSVSVPLSQAASVITYDYALTTNPTSLSFPAAGGDKTYAITSTKQKKVNGKNSGNPVAVNYNVEVTGTGFSKGAGTENMVIAAANTDTAVRTGAATVTAAEGGKTTTVTLTQEGATAP